MTRAEVNRVSGIAPVGMSILALLLVLLVVSTGWERGSKDEGAAAHIFQLLIILQIPVGLAFLATANWSQGGRVAKRVAAMAIALVLAVGSVALFRL